MSEEIKRFSDEEIIAARTKLWHMGTLEWKFSPSQKKMYDFWRNVKGKTSVLLCSRRIGKSHFLTTLAIQQCLQKENSIVKFLQPEQKMVRQNIKPLMDEILKDCPPELRPRFKTQDNVYVFPNGSEIQLAGTDNGNHEKLRGGNADLCLIDEAGFVNGDLGYIVRSVLMPTTLLTHGKIILSSTAPVTHDHDFAKYLEAAEVKGNALKINIFEALEDCEREQYPLLTREIVEEFINEYPKGRADDEFRRELMCEIINDGNNAVFPEFSGEVIDDIVVEWPRPAFCDRYVSMDIGFKDLTAILFAYYDFENGVTVIEDEIVISGPKMTTQYLAEQIYLKERELWTDPVTGEFTEPYRRIADNNLIVINDLQRLHGITFLPTSKDNKEMQVNNARIDLSNRQIYINPRCKTLIQHLKNATWDKHHRSFNRSPDSGHYDAADSFIYLMRNIDKGHNPFPAGYSRQLRFGGSGDIFVNPNHTKQDSTLDQFAKMFEVKSRRKIK